MASRQETVWPPFLSSLKRKASPRRETVWPPFRSSFDRPLSKSEKKRQEEQENIEKIREKRLKLQEKKAPVSYGERIAQCYAAVPFSWVSDRDPVVAYERLIDQIRSETDMTFYRAKELKEEANRLEKAASTSQKFRKQLFNLLNQFDLRYQRQFYKNLIDEETFISREELRKDYLKYIQKCKDLEEERDNFLTVAGAFKREKNPVYDPRATLPMLMGYLQPTKSP